MRIHRLAVAIVALFGALPLQAEPPVPAPAVAPMVARDVAALGETMQIGAVLEVMRLEGLDYGTSLEAQMFPGRGGAQWQAVVGLIYDASQMRQRFDAAFQAELANDAAAIPAMQAFFGSPLGQRILDLELAARRALMDDAASHAAAVTVERMIATQDPRMTALRRFADTNDLIEQNVAGALNSNLAFYRGMAENGGFGQGMTEDQMLADVWAQEDTLRSDTSDWLFSYLVLAYQPLSDHEMAAYQAFSETPAGQQLNAAVFAAFDVVFTGISRDLGRAAAGQMQGKDL